MLKNKYFLTLTVLIILLTCISASFAADEISDNTPITSDESPVITDNNPITSDVGNVKENDNTYHEKAIPNENKVNNKINTIEEKNIKSAPASTGIAFSKSYRNANQTVDITAILRSGGVGLAGEKLSIQFNNDTRTFITDSTGSVNQVYNVTKLGTQTIIITYNGSNDYKPCTRTETFERARSNLLIRFSLNKSAIYVDDEVTISTQLVERNLTAIPNEKVNITLNNQTYTNLVTDKNGFVNITYKVKEAKVNTITAVHERDDWYEYQMNYMNFNTYKLGTSDLFWSKYDTINYTYTVSVRLYSDSKTVSGEKFRFIFNGKEVQAYTDQDGFANVTFKLEKGGEQYLEVYFDETDKYRPHNRSKTFTTYTYNTTVTTIVNNTTAQVGKTIPITAQLNYTASNGSSLKLSKEPVTIRVNNQNFTGTTDNKGQYTINYTPTSEGILNVTSYYNQGQFKFNTSQSKKLNINVSSDSSDAIIKVVAPKIIDTGKTITINLTATDTANKALNGKAIVKINGLTITDTKTNSTVININNGKGTLTTTLASYSGKEYTVLAVFSKTGYNRAENTTKMTVRRSTYKTFTLTYNTTSESKINIKQTLKDVNNNPIYGNTQVAIKIGDRTVLTTTVVNGKLDVNVTVPFLPPGENKFKITLGENYRYTTKIINSTVNIEKQNVTVTFTPIKSQAGKKITIKAKLVNSKTKTNVISGKYIFKVNGKTVPLIVNNTEKFTTQDISNGIAQWTYTLPSDLKKGTYEILISYNGNTQSNPIKYSQKALTIN